MENGLLEIDSSTISDNSDVLAGGGIANMGRMTICTSTISGNTARLSGGGIANMDRLTVYTNERPETVDWRPSTDLAGNDISNGAYAVIRECTVTNNAAWGGGGIDFGWDESEPRELQSSIIAGNYALCRPEGGPDLYGYVRTCGCNLLGIVDSTAEIVQCGVAGPDLIGTPACPLDPLLTRLQDNEGPTLTHALRPGSPAIDALRNVPGSENPAKDQRGMPRQVDGDGDGWSYQDIGAYEAGISAYEGGIVPSIGDMTPSPNSHTAPVDTNVSVHYDTAVSPASVSNETFVVHGTQTESPPGETTVNGTAVVFNPTGTFHAGELVEVTATNGIQDTNAQRPLDASVSRFWTRAESGGGALTDIYCHLGPEFNHNSDQHYHPCLGDLDGNGTLDACIVSPSGSFSWLNNGGDRWYVEHGSAAFSAPLHTQEAALGDLDGDGDLDILSGNYLGPARVWLNEEVWYWQGPYFIAAEELYDWAYNYGGAYSGEVTEALVLGDLDGDGDLDAIMDHFGGIAVWLNDGHGAFTLDSHFHNREARALALGDMDSDGDLDLVALATSLGPARDYSTVYSLWRNNGIGQFTEYDAGLSCASGLVVAVDDLDGDGSLDLFTDSEVWLNDGHGYFQDSGQRLPQMLDAVLGDLDGNGFVDIVGTRYRYDDYGSSYSYEVWTNDGGRFMDSHQRLPRGVRGACALGDLDGDGCLDLCGPQMWSGESWWQVGSAFCVWRNFHLGKAVAALDTPDEAQLVIDRVSAASVEAFTSQLAGLPARDSGQLIDIVLNLDRGTAGTFDDQINVPDGYRLVITGDTSWGYHTNTISGNWTVASGAVLVQGVTLVNSSDVPTILVQGGSLTLRDCTIEETSGGQRAAVEIVGGTADLGTSGDPGNNILIIRGEGEFIHNGGTAAVFALGNLWRQDERFITADNFAIERRVFDAIDSSDSGLVRYLADAGSVYTTIEENQSFSLDLGCWRVRERFAVRGR